MYFCFRSPKPKVYTKFRTAKTPKGSIQDPKKFTLLRGNLTIPRAFRRYATQKPKKNIRDELKNMRKPVPNLVYSVPRGFQRQPQREQAMKNIPPQSRYTRSQNRVGQPQKISYDEGSCKERCSNSQSRQFEKRGFREKRIAGLRRLSDPRPVSSTRPRRGGSLPAVALLSFAGR